MTVDDVFFIRGRGVVTTGKVQDGVVRVGDEVSIGGRAPVRVDGIEAFRKTLEQAQAGDNIGLLFSGLDKSDISRGDVIADADTIAPGPPGALPDWPGGLPPG